MEKLKNILIKGANEKPVALDIFYTGAGPKKLVIYAHGFNGFKDWGNFDMIAAQFAEAGFLFVKFNFSHNGTTPDDPENFADLEAFAQNNYTKELYDLQQVIDWCLNGENPFLQSLSIEKLFLLGHSMGGGIALLKAAEEPRVDAITTWASIAYCKTPWGNWPKEKIDEWKSTGVQYIINGRTKQEMPLNYQLYINYEENKERLDILKAVSTLQIPLLICHSTADEAVPFQQAIQIKEAAKKAILFSVDSDHVFGRKHPWIEPTLPEAAQKVVMETITFFKEIP